MTTPNKAKRCTYEVTVGYKDSWRQVSCRTRTAAAARVEEFAREVVRANANLDTAAGKEFVELADRLAKLARDTKSMRAGAYVRMPNNSPSNFARIVVTR